MDESDRKASESTNPQAPSYSAVMARAVFSAAIFGAIGAWLGRWMGTHGNPPSNTMTKSVMKWSMGGFWALVAAYSSLKASEHEAGAAREGQKQTGMETSARAEKMPTSPRAEEASHVVETTTPAMQKNPSSDLPVHDDGDKKIPLTSVAAPAAHVGEVVRELEHQV